jgi:hypothetical protein
MENLAKLQEVWLNYVKFMVDWAEGNVSDEEKAAFKRDPRPILVSDKIGMKIPEGVKVAITYTMAWPAIYVKVKNSPRGASEWIVLEKRESLLPILGFGNGNPVNQILDTWRQKAYEMDRTAEETKSDIIAALEEAYDVTVQGVGIEEPPSYGIETGAQAAPNKEASMYIDIPAEFADCEVGVRLPFLTLEDHMLGGVVFDDGQEISLSTCC